MTPERWQQIEQLYHAALERAETERAAFLAEVCAGDEALRTEIEALLSANAEAGSFMAAPALELEVRKQAQALSARRLASGQQLNHYQIISQIGAGGMGEVYLARDLKLDRHAALKVLPAAFTADAGRLQRFVREAKAASALNHPNIITIYEIGETRNESGATHFIATEFIEGVTLRARLAADKLPLREALEIAQQVARALDAAHRAGIVHRDIKPENIMLRPDGLVKVLDFGLARFSERRPAAVDSQAPTAVPLRTDPGAVMGTVNYMSPEQARGLDVDARSDVFSLGIVLYEMAAGQRPFQGATPTDVMLAIVDKAPPPLPVAAPELQQVLDRMLEKDSEQRYAAVRDCAAEFERLKQALTAAESQPTLQLPSPRSLAAPATDTDSHTSNTTGAPPPLRARGWWTGALLGLLLSLTALGVGVYRWLTLSTPPGPEPSFTPLIGQDGTKDFAAISPDESRVAFAWDGGANAQVSPRDIYFKLIGLSEPVRLTSAPEDEAMPAYSPDGRYLAFVRVLPDRREIYRIPSVPTPGVKEKEEKLGETSMNFSWSPDSHTLAVSQGQRGSEPSGIFLLNIESQALTRLTSTPSPVADGYVAFAPDGRSVAFIRSFGITETDICIVPVNGGEVRQVSNIRNRIHGVTWTADSRELVFTATRGGQRQMLRVAARGGPPAPVAVKGENPAYPTVSRTGSKLAWTESLSDSNIWLYEGPGFAGHDAPGRFGAPVRLIRFPREDHSPEFSPDGERIVFASGRSGGEDLWLCDRDGRNPTQLTKRGGPTGTPHWSPDSRWIAFDSHTRGDADIYVVSADGSGPWRRLTYETSSDTQPSWSHDGRWVYFKSNRSGRGEMYRMPAEGGAAIQLTKGGAFEGFESPDGKLLYFSKGRGVYGLWMAPVEGGEEQPVPELKQAGYWRSWGVLKEGIYFISKEPGPRQTIRFFSFATRRITPLLTVEKDALWWQAGLALSPDGKRLLFAQVDHAVDEIWLMENFR